MKKIGIEINLTPFLAAWLMLFWGCGVRPEIRTPETSGIIEERGVWLNRSELFLPRNDLIHLLDSLKEAHFTSVYIDTYFKGCVIYPQSKYLPQYPDVSEPDILSWLIPEIKKRGMHVEAWVGYGFYAWHTKDAAQTSDRGAFLTKYPELTAIAADGTPYLHNKDWGDFFSLCPANPKSHKLLGDLFVEILKRYPFDGLNLDRIRFPNETFCFCDYCKGHFKKDTGLDLKLYEKGSEEYRKFIEWRKDQLTGFMETNVPRFRAVRPGLCITLDALPPDMMDSHAQPWDVWLGKGYLDAALPMLYGEYDFENRVKTVRQFPKWDMIFCGIDAHNLSPDKVQAQIRFLKDQGARGCVLWYSGQIRDDLPYLKSGPFSRPAATPLRN